MHLHHNDALRDTKCPACDYDLRGTPNTRRCTECGLSREPGDIWFRPSGFLHRAAPYIVLVAFVCFASLWWSEASSGFPNWTLFDRLVMALATSGPALFFLGRWKYHYPYEYVLVGRKGISWRVAGRPEVKIDWNDIANVSGSRFLDQVLLQQYGSRYSTKLPRCLRPKHTELNSLVELVTRCWKESRSNTPGRSS